MLNYIIADIRTSKSLENFYNSYLNETDNMPRNKISNAFANDSFAVLFTYLELRREFTEDYMKVRKKARLENLYYWIIG